MRQSISLFLLTLFAVTLIPSLVLSGDLGGFKVSSFIPEKFSDLEWKIGGHFNLAGSDTETEVEAAPWYDGVNRDSWRSSNNQYLRFQTGTVYLHETVARQFELRADFDGSLSHNGSSGGGNLSRESNDYSTVYDEDRSRWNFGFSTYVTGLYRQYYGPSFFTEFKVAGGKNRSGIMHEDLYESHMTSEMVGELRRVSRSVISRETRSTDQHNYGTFELALGAGHLWEGSFASTAMHIIDQLDKEGLIRKEPTYDQMQKLSRIIYEYRQTRPIDSRLHRQEAMDVIIRFLEDEHLAQNLNHHAHFMIHDIWDYYPSRQQAPRLFGLRVSVAIGYRLWYRGGRSEVSNMFYSLVEQYDPGNPSVRDTLDFRYDNSYSDRRSGEYLDAPYLVASLEYHYPINHLWQFDATSILDLNLEENDYRSRRRAIRNSHDHASARLEATRIFDARTRISGYLSTHCYFDRMEKYAPPGDTTYPVLRKVWHTDVRIQAGCEIIYRLAIPTTINIRADFSSRYVRTPGYATNVADDSQGYSLTAGINHFIY